VIVLDTNVFSEALKPAPSSVVAVWLRAQDRAGMFITAITEAEVLYGVESLPHGRRRSQLLDAVEDILKTEYEGRILSFDEPSARLFAQILATREAAGRPISDFDAMIAAIARSHGAAVATRNTKDFEGCGIKTINPWSV
jgi:predicted nucleic acid-binding protein